MHKSKTICLFFLATLMVAVPAASAAQVSVGVAIHIGPPALPVYAQPICPGAGHIWTPGYWAYGPEGYYWVPGTWVLAPRPGLLWTPGYWGWAGGVYAWHAGYWGPHVGFYGGVNYGFGYGGVGFVGGRWNGGVFAYNAAVTNVNTTVIHNTYVDKTVVVNNPTVNQVSYNGGTGGTTAQPTAAERAAENEKHVPPTSEQANHEHAASTNRSLLERENHGRPSIAGTSKPGEFKGRGVEAAKSGNESHNSAAHNAASKNARTHNTDPAHANKQNSSNKGTHSSESKPKKPAPRENKEKPEHSHGG
jgi:WXXGXW repeat (2 copies)